MKKTILFSLAFIISSCVSVKKHNEKLEVPISVEDLKKDVDFTQRKLEELHPNLYWFISKKDLNYQLSTEKSGLHLNTV